MSHRLVVLTGLSLFLLSACQGGLPPDAKKLTAVELRQTVVGTTAYGTGANGSSFVSYTSPNGTMRMTSGAFSDRGTYRIEDDGRICLKWTVIRGGAETCQTLWHSGAKDYAVMADGSVTSVIHERKPGDMVGP